MAAAKPDKESHWLTVSKSSLIQVLLVHMSKRLGNTTYYDLFLFDLATPDVYTVKLILIQSVFLIVTM